jgi:hypothetical protein
MSCVTMRAFCIEHESSLSIMDTSSASSSLVKCSPMMISQQPQFSFAQPFMHIHSSNSYDHAFDKPFRCSVMATLQNAEIWP